MSTVGNNISRRRKELGWTQEELAKRMGYKSKSTINKIELGKNDIPQNKIIQFALVLNTTPAYLMGWTEENAPAAVSDEDVKVALFGGDTEVTDEMWDEVMNYANYLKMKYKK